MSTTLEAPRQVAPAVPGTASAPEPRGRPPLRRAWLFALLVLGLLIVAGPFLWMIFGSLKTQRELLQAPPTWIPENPTLNNYTRLWERLDFARYFWNSALIAVAITACWGRCSSRGASCSCRRSC